MIHTIFCIALVAVFTCGEAPGLMTAANIRMRGDDYILSQQEVNLLLKRAAECALEYVEKKDSKKDYD